MEPAASIGALTIPSWANGPDESGNGGWTAGLLAAQVRGDGGVVVNLLVPPPIGRPLQVRTGPDGVLLLIDATGDDEPVIVATAAVEQVEIEVPDAVRSVRPAAATAAREHFPLRDHHPFPRCVCCGTTRDGGLISLGIHCGAVDGVTVEDASGASVPVFADAWTPSPELDDPGNQGHALVEACWSALDCPSATPFVGDPDRGPAVLARIAARIDRTARVGRPHVLAAWQRSVDGRKLGSASVLMDADGEVLGVAHALWIELRRG